MAINEWMWVSFFISINEIGVTYKDQRKKKKERNKCCTLSNTSNNEVSKEASPCAALCLQFQKTSHQCHTRFFSKQPPKFFVGKGKNQLI